MRIKHPSTNLKASFLLKFHPILFAPSRQPSQFLSTVSTIHVLFSTFRTHASTPFHLPQRMSCFHPHKRRRHFNQIVYSLPGMFCCWSMRTFSPRFDLDQDQRMDFEELLDSLFSFYHLLSHFRLALQSYQHRYLLKIFDFFHFHLHYPNLPS